MDRLRTIRIRSAIAHARVSPRGRAYENANANNLPECCRLRMLLFFISDGVNVPKREQWWPTQPGFVGVQSAGHSDSEHSGRPAPPLRGARLLQPERHTPALKSCGHLRGPRSRGNCSDGAGCIGF